MTPREEADTILSLSGGDVKSALELAERQLNIVQVRAQALMSLAGVVVTVTGFSGRIVAQSGAVAQISIVIGLFAVLASAVWLYARTMPIRWVTKELEADPITALERIILRRDRKTRAYRLGGIILCVGFVFYCVALGAMLLWPEAAPPAASVR